MTSRTRNATVSAVLPDGAVIRDLDPRRDSEAVVRLAVEAFGGDVNPDRVKGLKALSPKAASFHRVLDKDGEVAAYMDVRPGKMWLGRSLLSFGGIATVATSGRHRMKGYGRALMEDSLRLTAERGFDLSLLWGIPDYYARFGYECVMPRLNCTIAMTEIPRARHYTFNRSGITKADAPALLRLYNEMTRHCDGNVVRDRFHAERGMKLTDSRGRIVAYATWKSNEGTLVVFDAIARDMAAAREILFSIKMAAWHEGLDYINLWMPTGCPVTDALRAYNFMSHCNNPADRGWMGVVTRLDLLVKKMEAEWSWRLAQSRFVNAKASISLKVGEESFSIDCDKGRAKAKMLSGGLSPFSAPSRRKGTVPFSVTATPQRFAQMLFGFRAIPELAQDPDVKISPASRDLAEVLFPERAPFIHCVDRF